MIRRRIGNDLHLTWTVNPEMSKEPLSSKEFSVHCTDPLGQAVPVETFAEEDSNHLRCIIRGRLQRNCGIHLLRLVENANQDGMHTVDTKAFELVPHSWMEDIGDAAFTSVIQEGVSSEEYHRLVQTDERLQAQSEEHGRQLQNLADGQEVAARALCRLSEETEAAAEAITDIHETIGELPSDETIESWFHT